MTDLTQKEIIEGVTDALAALIPDDINDDYRADTGRLIKACCEVLSDDFQPKEIKDALTGFDVRLWQLAGLGQGGNKENGGSG